MTELDADDLESISLALRQLSTWFPETLEKVERMRDELEDAERDHLADRYTADELVAIYNQSGGDIGAR